MDSFRNQTDRLRVGQRGMFFPLLLVVVGIVFVYSVQSLFLSRQNLNVTVRLASQDMLYQAALGALEAAEAEMGGFAGALASGSDLAGNPLYQDLASRLTDSSGLPRVVEFEKALDLPAFRFIEDRAGPGVSITSSFSISGSEPIIDPGRFPAIPDDRERNFDLKISATALTNGVSVTVVAFTRGRLLFTHVPPFSKFTLNLFSPGAFRADAMADQASVSADPGTVAGPAIILDNGRVLEEGEALQRTDLASLLSGQGFVLLGGGTWELGHSSGWSGESSGDAGLRAGIFTYDISAPPSGGPEGMRFYSRERELTALAMTAACGEYMRNAGTEKIRRSSYVRIFGTRSGPSPTLVFGNVRRRYVLEQGICDTSGERVAPLPFMPDSGAFDSWGWPSSTGPDARDFVYRQLFSCDYVSYSSRMSTVVTEDFNRGHLAFLEAPGGAPSPLWPEGFPGGALPVPGVEANGAVLAGEPLPCNGITLRCEDGNIVFTGDPWGEDITGYLDKRVCYSHRSASAFTRNRTDGGVLRVRGIEKVPGRLVIDRRLTVPSGCGGVILAEGDLVVAAPIDCEAGAHLYLVSLGGDMVVDTSGEIEACLAAPKGRILLPARFSIKGGVTARSIHPDSFNTSSGGAQGPKTIEYDQDLDFTRREVFREGFRFILRERWERYVR